MKKNRNGIVLLWVALAVFTFAESALAVDSELSRESLRGLKGVAVIIEGLDEKTGQSGLTAALIRADIEEKLRLAGIQVLSEEQLIKEPGQPSLYASVSLLKLDGLNVSNIYLGLHQGVLLMRNMNTPFMSDTWSISALMTGDHLYMREALKNSTDKFIKAFISMNPR